MFSRCLIWLGLIWLGLILAWTIQPSVAATHRDPITASLSDVPHIQQLPGFGGEACTVMALQRLGHKHDQLDIFNLTDLHPEVGRGCSTHDMARLLPRIGFDVGTVWQRLRARDDQRTLEAQWDKLLGGLAAGYPVLVSLYEEEKPKPEKEESADEAAEGENGKSQEGSDEANPPERQKVFLLVVGFDAGRESLLVHNPASPQGAFQPLSKGQFLKRWPVQYRNGYWTAQLRLKPIEITRPPVRTKKFTRAHYAQHIIKVREKLPDGFTIVLESPFVVIGDEQTATVKSRATGTVQWAVDHLKQSYFERDPDDILNIWLFKDKESYLKHNKAFFNEVPGTPFGYYSSRHRALVMNISTGGGTLVHEIVHPFIASNFPQCPSWFNEGLASLYEQCGDERGRIVGYTNWRLKGLQRAIRPPKETDEDDAEAESDDEKEEEEPKSRVPSFKWLCHTTTREFYQEDPGTNYAQARYLCYYLQQRNLLRRYYREFRQNVRSDPTGYQTLMNVLNLETDAQMEQFKNDWEEWIMGLRF